MPMRMIRNKEVCKKVSSYANIKEPNLSYAAELSGAVLLLHQLIHQ